jgi:hypothetical protein
MALDEAAEEAAEAGEAGAPAPAAAGDSAAAAAGAAMPPGFGARQMQHPALQVRPCSRPCGSRM